MENTANTTQREVSNAKDTNVYQASIDCSIRRKPNTTGLPGQDPNERRYRIGASLDNKTGKNKKGISGELETKYLPEIIGVSLNDPSFRRLVDEYWSGINRAVAPDEPSLREHERGEVLKIAFTIVGAKRKEKMALLPDLVSKMEYLNTLLITPISKENSNTIANLDYDTIADYLLLNYCLVYNKVANRAEDMDNSPKIDFYLFEKVISVKNQLTFIELRSKAMRLFETLVGNENKINSLLLMFEELPSNFETEDDKLIAIDTLYNLNPSNMRNFVNYVEDENWEIKYIINRSIKQSKIRKNVGSDALYYNDQLLGMSLDEAAKYLLNEETGKMIRQSLERETK